MAIYQTEEVVEDVNVDSAGNVIKTTKRVSPAPVPDEHPQQAFHTKKTIFRSYQVIWYLLGVLEVILGFRFVLRLLGANPLSGFASFIYAISYPFVLPFINLFSIPQSSGFALESGTLFAMIFYLLLAWAFVKLFQMAKPATPEEVDRAVSV